MGKNALDVAHNQWIKMNWYSPILSLNIVHFSKKFMHCYLFNGMLLKTISSIWNPVFQLLWWAHEVS
jgi:hypothetical protein